jgi:hypothetical protein
LASSKYHTFSSHTRPISDTLPLLDMFYMRVVNFVHKCLRSESSLVNGIVRHGIIYGHMESTIGLNVLNCSSRYKISLNDIVNLAFQPRDIYSYCCANVGSSVSLSPLIELLQCRDGSPSLPSSEFNMADISSIIDFICTSE